MIIPDGMMTVPGVAKRYHLSRATVYLAIKQGRLTAHTLFGRLLVTHEHAAKWRATLGKPGRPKKHLTTVKQLQRGTYEPI